MFANLIFEPVSGFVQDKIGQVQIFWFGNFFWGLSFLTYYFGETYWHFVFAEILGALGMAAVVGSLEAFLENKLGLTDAKKTRTQGRSLERFFQMIPATLGSFIAARYGLGMPFIISSIFCFIFLIISVFILKPLISIPNRRHKHEDVKVRLNLIDVSKFVFSQKQLIVICVILFTSKFVFQAYNMTWTRIFATEISEKYIGGLWIGVSLAMILGFKIASKLPNTITIILISLAGIGISMFFGSIASSIIVTLILFYVHELIRAIFTESIESYSATFFPNNIRSSAKSVLQTVSMLGAMIGLPVTGWLGDKLGLKETWTIVSAFLMLFTVASMIFILLYKRKHSKS